MTFNELWEALLAKNGKLANDDAEVVFKAGNLKKLLRQVWDQAQKHERDLNKTMREILGKKNKFGPNPMGDIFDEMFGGGGR